MLLHSVGGETLLDAGIQQQQQVVESHSPGVTTSSNQDELNDDYDPTATTTYRYLEQLCGVDNTSNYDPTTGNVSNHRLLAHHTRHKAKTVLSK